MFDRKAAFWVTSTLFICMFAIFIILTLLVTPRPLLDHGDMNDGTNNEYLVELAQDLSNMVWWITVGFVMLPIMLLLLILAIFLYFTSQGEGQHGAESMVKNVENAPTIGVRPPGDASKADSKPATDKQQSIDPKDALELRYARGEVTREQYLDMQRELKNARL